MMKLFYVPFYHGAHGDDPRITIRVVLLGLDRPVQPVLRVHHLGCQVELSQNRRAKAGGVGRQASPLNATLRDDNVVRVCVNKTYRAVVPGALEGFLGIPRETAAPLEPASPWCRDRHDV